MVKGNSKQVIVVNNPDEKLFEQAIFILKDDAVKEGITDKQLLREAKRAAGEGGTVGQNKRMLRGPVWACFGAAATALLWILSAIG